MTQVQQFGGLATRLVAAWWIGKGVIGALALVGLARFVGAMGGAEGSAVVRAGFASSMATLFGGLALWVLAAPVGRFLTSGLE